MLLAAVGCVGTIDAGGGGVVAAAMARMPVPRSPPPSSGPRPRSRTTPCPPVINLDAPQSSRILSKGAHSGPALDAGAASAILTWIEAEKTAANPTGSGATLVQTAHFKPLLCSNGAAGGASCPYNNVTLDALGAGGASIQLVVQELGTGIYVNEMQLIGGTGSGAYIEHPLVRLLPDRRGPERNDDLGRVRQPEGQLIRACAEDLLRQVRESPAGGFRHRVETRCLCHFRAGDG